MTMVEKILPVFVHNNGDVENTVPRDTGDNDGTEEDGSGIMRKLQ